MAPPLRRQDIVFPEKDRALRTDVGTLGTLVGDIIREQEGDALFDIVESARLRAIRRREGNEIDGEELEDLVQGLEPELAMEVTRAFSTYFQMVNTAEKVHRIRRRREYLQDHGSYQPGGFEDMLIKLKAAGISFERFQKLLNGLRIEPVFTAHPTEPTRRTILRKEQHIVRRLVDLLNPTMTAQERSAALHNIRLEVTTGWQTDEHPSEQMTVADELEHVLFFLTDVLYRAIPPLYEDMQDAAERVFGDEAKELFLPTIVRFSSWVGGDMDGNPNVNAKTIRESLARQRQLVLDLYYNECASLSAKLSQAEGRTEFDANIYARIEEYRGAFPNAYHAVPARHRDMPYRVLLRLIQQRLQATYDDDAYPYESSRDLEADIRLIARSLKRHKGENAGLFAINRMLRRIRTFGFHLATLDIRQNASVLREVVGECLGDEQWLERSPQDRLARIEEAINSREGPMPGYGTTARKTLNVFHSIASCQRKYGRRAIGPFIVSMTEGADDILSVILLAHWGELSNKRGEVPLDITPLLETVGDLDLGPEIMRTLLGNPVYAQHLKSRGDRQTIMVGYSDSNKDSGIVSARWALQNSQIRLVDEMAKHEVTLTLFHGRGGTVSRGGGKTHAAILAAPPGTVNGRLRVTEQGEIINEKFGLRGIALRTLEQTIGAVALASAFPRHRGGEEPEWHEMMDYFAQESRKAYRNLVYDSPRFWDYFRRATPIDVIERMRIGSRPASRDARHGVAHLRAIPWVFAWTQARFILPGWFGFGSGLSATLDKYGAEACENMISNWYFLRALFADVEMVIAKADINIAEMYSRLAGDLHDEFFPIIRKEFDTTSSLLLNALHHQSILEDDDVLQRSIMMRNPYVDPMSMLQIDLLERWRRANGEDEQIFDALLASINGIAQGLQNTG
jgi:phosphoenolpyruvate carboxylase